MTEVSPSTGDQPTQTFSRNVMRLYISETESVRDEKKNTTGTIKIYYSNFIYISLRNISLNFLQTSYNRYRD